MLAEQADPQAARLAQVLADGIGWPNWVKLVPFVDVHVVIVFAVASWTNRTQT